MKSAFFYLLLLAFAINTCSCKHSLQDGAVVLGSYDGAPFAGRQVNSDTLQLSFLNNPFNLTERDSVFFSLDNKLVYQAAFKEHDIIFLSRDQYKDLHPQPGLIIKRGGTFYSFLGKRSVAIGMEDRYLYIIFCPENNRNENFFVFSQKEFIH